MRIDRCICGRLVIALLGCSGGAPHGGKSPAGLGVSDAGGSGMTATMALGGAGAAAGTAGQSGTGAIGFGNPAGRGGNAGRSADNGDAGSARTMNAPVVDCAPASFPNGATTCHSDEDCSVGTPRCMPEIAPPQQCGSPCPGCATNRCTTDADCGRGVCEPSKEFPGVIMQCVPHCSASGCAAGERCESHGRCRPVPCTEGFSCAEHTRCSAGSVLADVHGCEPIPCDEAGGAQCAAPSVCTREAPRIATTPHGCALVPCADPRHPACEPNTRCRPELETQDSYGCARMTCKSDADCDCGACIVRSGSEGYCYNHIGVCVAGLPLTCPP